MGECCYGKLIWLGQERNWVLAFWWEGRKKTYSLCYSTARSSPLNLLYHRCTSRPERWTARNSIWRPHAGSQKELDHGSYTHTHRFMSLRLWFYWFSRFRATLTMLLAGVHISMWPCSLQPGLDLLTKEIPDRRLTGKHQFHYQSLIVEWLPEDLGINNKSR